jgi:hypothetical protein
MKPLQFLINRRENQINILIIVKYLYLIMGTILQKGTNFYLIIIQKIQVGILYSMLFRKKYILSVKFWREPSHISFVL